MKFKGIKFFIVVVIIYMIVFLFDFQNGSLALEKSFTILKKIAPIFILIILITTLINYFLKPKEIVKHFGKESGKKGIFYALIGGVLSHGPMYAWYGMLEDMKSYGLKDELIAIFLYARSIKLPLLPIMIDLFGWIFTIVITIYILIAALLQGKVINSLLK